MQPNPDVFYWAAQSHLEKGKEKLTASIGTLTKGFLSDCDDDSALYGSFLLNPISRIRRKYMEN